MTTTVSWYGPKNQAGYGLSIAPQTDGRMLVWDTRQDLAACVAWKQVMLVFHSLPQNWRRRDDGWYTWRHRGGHVGIKSKTDEPMR
jgi:hypothetical protein